MVGNGQVELTQITRRVQRVIVVALLAMMLIVVVLATVRLGWILIELILTPPLFQFRTDDVLRIVGFFLMTFIAIELAESIQIYLVEDRVHVEFVMMVAMTALARKVITLDFEKFAGLTLIGLAAVILALGLAFFFIKGRATFTAPSGAGDGPGMGAHGPAAERGQ